ncbi:MAG TPA: DUF3592 domain-containing protein [Terracidiphilus sp.]|jgi:hypothetical protein
MSTSWKSIAGSLILGAVIAFALGGWFIYNAMRYAALAPNESTATAFVRLHTRPNRNETYEHLRCEYGFDVGERFYQGQGICPLKSADDSVKGKLLDLAKVLDGTTVTVYYDPADPSTNSLAEFSVTSKRDYLYAKLSIGVGVMLVIFLVLGALLVANMSGGSRGIVVDAEGTVIYPDEMNSGQQENTNDTYQAGSGDEQSDHSANY